MKRPAQRYPDARDSAIDFNGVASLVDLLQLRAQQQPYKRAYTFLTDGEQDAEHLNYSELDRQARRIAAALQALDMQRQRAVLLYSPGLDYIAAFFGCLYAGVVAVPAYPPKNQRNLPRLQAILDNSQASVMLSTGRIAAAAQALFSANSVSPKAQWLLTDGTMDYSPDAWRAPELNGDTLAFLQYTSGSTGLAKGVMVSHGNLMANQDIIRSDFGHDADSTVVGWLPLYHDMGLIGNVMQPLYIGAPVILMPPMAFLEKPLRWLQAISDYRAHTSGGPNFAFDLCVEKISAADKAGLDLSSWQLAFNGSEPIHAATLDRFVQAFAGCGFRREAFYPCYGLAEATLLVSGGAKSLPPTVKTFDKARLAEHLACSKVSQLDDYRRLVACGTAGLGHQLRIADRETGMVCPDGHIGEIQASGPSISQGYWQNTEATAETFITDDQQKVWLRTGDLGFIDHGELFVSGRIKDLIIVRGKNYYPHDIEAAAQAAVTCLNPGGLAAFAATGDGEEKLVLLAELKRGHLKHHLKQSDGFLGEFAAIRSRLVEECGLQADTIVFLKPGTILKTTSGKIRRTECRAAFENQQWEAVAVDSLNPSLPSHQQYNRQEAHTQVATLPEQLLPRKALLLATPEDGVELLSHTIANKVAALAGLALADTHAFDSIGKTITQLGIDSLKAMELKYFLDNFLDIDLPVVVLLEGQSLHAIAGHALKLAKHSTAETLPSNRETRLKMPLSLGQQAIWTICQIEQETAVYTMPVALHIGSEINAGALSSALNDLLDRHAQLRTQFKADANGLPVQTAVPTTTLLLEHIACGDEQDRQQQLKTQIHAPFNLAQGPLLRTVLFSTSANNHILLFCAHHIAVDFRSMSILLDELKTLYTAYVSGQTPRLPPLTASYEDYIAWQQRYLHSPQAEAAAAYWQQQMGGTLPKLVLPTDKPRPTLPSYLGGTEMLKIDAHTAKKLRELADQHNATLYMVLLSVFKVLLYRYSSQQDIIVGSPVVGRPKQDFSDLVGYFANPVPLRSHPSANQNFIAYLEEIRQTVLGALQHQDYPFSLLVETMQPERNGSLSPFYQVMFVLQGGASAVPDAVALALGIPGAMLDWPDMKAEALPIKDGIAQFDMTLLMAETSDGLMASFQYRRDLFSREAVLRMLGHFQCLLQGILADPSTRLSALPLLTIPERQQQLATWNQTRSAYPQELCLQQWFEKQAVKTPDAIAAVYQQQHISYAALNAKANQLANYLRKRGARPEINIAVCMERSLELLTSLLAVLKAGAAYVPIDPSYPAERQRYLLEDADCRLLLTCSTLGKTIANNQIETIYVDGDAPLYADGCTQNLPAWAVADNAAYLIYTSGSTGKPKGVVVSHRNAVHSTWARFRHYSEPVGCYLLLSSFAFDSSVAGIFWTLSQGGYLCLPEDNLPKDPSALGLLIEHHRVTHLLALPSLYAAVLEQVPISRLASLNTVIVAGEACPTNLATRHYTCLPDVRLDNEYGPTEATVWSTAHTVTPQDTDATIAIGRPVRNMQSYILDAYYQPVPVGIIGELHVGGDGITRGYLNRPDLTAEKFLPNPFGDEGSRLYKTGDLARYRANGAIEFCGRIDTQIKLRGYRIELGEIEAHIRQQPAVKEAVVLIREDQPGKQRLVAYLVMTPEAAADTAILKTQLKDSLPDYMIPSTFVFLDALPLNANGKLDRHALPIPEAQRPSHREPVAPRDEAEAAVADIWREILGIPQVCIHDNFFELGGHSLSGVQIMLRVQELFALELPVKLLFEAPTIAEFVDKVADYQANPGLYQNPNYPELAEI